MVLIFDMTFLPEVIKYSFGGVQKAHHYHYCTVAKPI